MILLLTNLVQPALFKIRILLKILIVYKKTLGPFDCFAYEYFEAKTEPFEYPVCFMRSKSTPTTKKCSSAQAHEILEYSTRVVWENCGSKYDVTD